MTQEASRRPALAANDNTPMGSKSKNMARGQGTPARYVYVGREPAMDAESGARTAKVARLPALVIATDLPKTIPILPDEVALIRGYMADLVSRILANDNEPT